MDILYAFIAINLLPIYARAHMQMSNPYPINSPLNPVTPEYLKDYNYTSPLLADGSNYPCKGYQTQSTSYNATTTYTAGGMYSMSVTGNTTYGGGSCQLSLSYDNGQTFKVIESMIGGCPISRTYNFTVPSFAPPSESALFAWSWFNEIGNREMYMNCARVEIQAPAPGRHRRAQHKRQSSMSSLPDLFVCNVNNGCTTIEQQDVQFPDPGSNVVYGSDDGTYPPSPGIGFTSIGNAPNSTASNTTMPSTTSTPDPFTNVSTLTYSVLLPNTSASIIMSESTPTVILTDFATVAKIIRRTPSSSLLLQVMNITATTLLTSTASSTSSCNSTLISSAAITTLTSPTSNLVPPTASSLSVIFANATSATTMSVPPPSLASTAQLPTFTNTTSVVIMSLTSSSQLLTFSNTTSSLTSPSTTLPVSNTITATMASNSPIASAAATLLAGPCSPGAFACNSAITFSQCVAGVGGTTSYAYLGPVAAGMQCSNGQIIRQNEGPCTPSGQLFCNGEYAFYLCDQGGLINMGPVAPGTACLNGVIGYPPSR